MESKSHASPDATIDLHIHSTASDGTKTPREIVERAVSLNLTAISITDHDTLNGVKDAIWMGIPRELSFFPGTEISSASPSFYPCWGSFHILGYGISTDDADLNETLESLQRARSQRNPKIIHKLNEIGLEICLEELEKTAAGGQAGRPHIASLLVRKGYVSSIEEAFGRYLGNGKIAYVEKVRIPCAEAIGIIRKAGGVPVLAHPGLLKPRLDSPLESAVNRLADLGLMGIEVFYPEHSEADTQRFLEIARRFNLVATGGTDFHGAIKPGVEMGRGTGDFQVPGWVLPAFAAVCPPMGSDREISAGGRAASPKTAS